MSESRRGSERVVQTKVGGQPCVGLLVKRTYLMLPHGRVALANEDAQEPLSDAEVPYEPLPLPRISPVRLGDDRLAFKPHTDVIVQGSGYTYHPRVIETQVSIRFGALKREIRVVGDRRGEWGPDGPVFSEPAPFLSLPIRYDHAYGGLDATALERAGLLETGTVISSLTPYHYPRNPAGKGYLIDLDRPSFEGLAIPNLEYVGDPLTPQRLAIGAAGAWLSAPLPAGMDWQASYCFPRCTRLGPDPQPDPDDPEPRLDFAQAASPGFTVPAIRLDDEIELNNLHPSSPVIRCALPAEAPRVLLSLPGKQVALQPHLNTVVLRPGKREIVVVWLASAPVDHLYPPETLEHLHRTVSFRRA